MKRVAILTSGGDAPGMNAFIRAAARAAIQAGLDALGVRRGYAGLIDGDFLPLDRRLTANRIAKGGTFLGTARCEKFYSAQGRAAAADQLRKAGVDGLLVCGGDGSFQGAQLLHAEHGISVVGVPGTIDNDLCGTDFTIGYDTAINTAAEAIDRIRDTAESHGRVFFIEVMGRHAGHIAMEVGIACGAEFIAVPESVTKLDLLRRRIVEQGSGRRTIVVVGEGDEAGGARDIAAAINKDLDIDSRITILGHIQRGGAPTVRDRILASNLGAAAVQVLLDGRSNVMVGEVGGELRFTEFRHTWGRHKDIPKQIERLAELLV